MIFFFAPAAAAIFAGKFGGRSIFLTLPPGIFFHSAGGCNNMSRGLSPEISTALESTEEEDETISFSPLGYVPAARAAGRFDVGDI